MDYSSLSDSQQQLLNQYQQYQHQQHDQTHQQQHQQQYDPSQSQPYDPSAQAYYPYSQPYQDPSSLSHQQPYSYYQPDYGAAAYQQPPQPDPNPNTHGHEASQMPADTTGEQPQQQPPSGLNHAVAAVTVDAADVAMQERLWHESHSNAGRPPHRRGGRRGRGPYRGGGRFGYRSQRPDGGAPPFRGRGRMGRGGGRRFTPHATAAAAPLSSSQHVGPTSAQEQPSAPAAAPASKPAKPPRQPPQVFWCEICMVECNTLEILEQHKNGKRHKKTLQRYEELQKLKKAESESQALATEQAENQNIDRAEENKTALATKESAPESSRAVASVDENKIDLEQQSQMGEQPEAAKVEPTEVPSMKRKMERYNNWRHPAKQKKFGRGGKQLRPSEAVCDPEVPKEPQSRYCSLCNVTCDTPAVFEVHLAGKKHQSRVRRFPGTQGGYGAVGFHTHYMPHAQGMGFIPQGPPAEGNGNYLAQQAGLGAHVQQTAFGTQVLYDLSSQGHQIVPTPAALMAHEVGGAVRLETVATQDNSGPTLVDATSGMGHVSLPVNDAVPAPEYGVALPINVILPGLGVQTEENGSTKQ